MHYSLEAFLIGNQPFSFLMVSLICKKSNLYAQESPGVLMSLCILQHSIFPFPPRRELDFV